MGNKVLEFIIRAKDLTGAGLNSARSSIQGMATRVSSGIKNMTSSLMGVVGITATAGAAVAGFASTLKAAFEFERYETQFKVLFGSLEKAKLHIQELQAFSAATPFQFGEIAEASRKLNVMTGGIMGATESLTLVGDAAAATGTQISELSMWVGRAYSSIKAGAPFGEAAMRLMELGVLTPEVRAEMEKLQASGASNAEVWALLEGALGRFKGGMVELSKTGEGLFSTLKDNWNLALAEFGKAFMDIAKDDIGSLADKLDELRQNGDIEVWAERAKSMLSGVGKAISLAGKGFSWISEKISYAAAYWGAKSAGASWKDAGGIATNQINSAKQHEEDIREKARTKAKTQEQTKNAKAYEAGLKGGGTDEKSLKEKIAVDMAQSQKKIDEERAKKAAEDELKEREKAEEALAKVREQEMKQLVEAEKDLKRQMISDLGEEERVQQDRLAKAEQAMSQAWAEYKDPALFKKRKEEEAKDAEFQKAYQKDKVRVGIKVASGMALTDQEQAAQRVMQAEAEKEAAQKALLEIASNTAKTKEMLEQLLRMK